MTAARLRLSEAGGPRRALRRISAEPRLTDTHQRLIKGSSKAHQRLRCPLASGRDVPLPLGYKLNSVPEEREREEEGSQTTFESDHTLSSAPPRYKASST